jgi:hypothetical protein
MIPQAAEREQPEDQRCGLPGKYAVQYDFVRWQQSYFFATAVLFAFSSAGYQSPVTSNQEPTGLLRLNPSEVRDTYEVYSAVLRRLKPTVETREIAQETKPITFCTMPTPGLESRYRPVIADYTLKNKSKLALEAEVDILDFRIISPTESTELVNFSAVGFDRRRMRAGDCYSVQKSAGNFASGFGECFLLSKQNGKWTNDPQIEGCGFGFGSAAVP